MVLIILVLFFSSSLSSAGGDAPPTARMLHFSGLGRIITTTHTVPNFHFVIVSRPVVASSYSTWQSSSRLLCSSFDIGARSAVISKNRGGSSNQ